MENNTDFSNLLKREKPWFKKPRFYIPLFLILILGYGAYHAGVFYHSISVENNGGFLDKLTALFDFNSGNGDNDLLPMPVPEEDRLDVLILGIRGEDKEAIEIEGGLLTDTIMILSTDKETGKSSMISIPRDLYINMKVTLENGEKFDLKGKINEVYGRGLSKNVGLLLTRQVVSKISGIYIDKAIVFDFAAFKKVVDTLGGIDLYLAKPFQESNQWGYEFHLPEGNNHLNGEQALYYVRSRYSTSDFDRARRQQDVIVAIKDRALSLEVLTSPSQINALLSDLKNDIRTDFRIWDIGDALVLAKTLGKKPDIKHFVITTDNLVYESKSAKGEYILLPKETDFAGFKNIFKEILTEAQPAN